MFPAGWNVVYDKLGDGCKIDFSVMRKAKYFTEVVCIT